MPPASPAWSSAIEDPNPEVAGQGHARLRAAGITVDVGLCAAEAAHDHAGHFRRIRDKRPHVILKLAVSADDKIGAGGGKPVAIIGRSGEGAGASAARAMRRDPGRDRHRAGGRSAFDLPAAGHGSAFAGAGGAGSEPADIRHSRLVHSARQTPLWVMTSNLSEAPAAMKLGAAGAHVIRVATTTAPPGLDLMAVLRALAEKGITRLLVEGGARVASSFVASELVDEVWLLRGPDAIGAGGVDALEALPLTAITQSPAFAFVLAKACRRIL